MTAGSAAIQQRPWSLGLLAMSDGEVTGLVSLIGLTLDLSIHLRPEQHGQNRQIRPQKKQRNRAQRSEQRIDMHELRRAIGKEH